MENHRNEGLATGREQWSSKLGFILAAAGSAVGLGNLWKFPYSVGNNGGGAFVLVYLLFLLVIGVPLMLAAITLGRKTQKSAVGAYRSINPNWSWVGGLGVACGFLILAFYSTVGGWVTYYFTKSVVGGFGSIEASEFGAVFDNFVASSGMAIFFQGIFLLMTVLIVVKGISGGIEKASKFMMPALFVMILLIMIRTLTLPGAQAGVEFLIKPDISKIDLDVIMNALGQVFFTLSIGMGVMITYGSYLGRGENLVNASGYIPALDTLVAFMAGFATLPAVFALGFEPTEGPGLMFVTLPAVFQGIPFGQFVLFLFFLLVLFAALTSSISMLEVCVAYFVDEKGASRKKAAVIITLIIFAMGIPSTLSMGPWQNIHVLGLGFFDLYDKLTANILLPLGGMLMTIFVAWVWGADYAIEEIQSSGVTFRFAGLWKFIIKYIAPLAVGIVFVNSIWSLINTVF